MLTREPMAGPGQELVGGLVGFLSARVGPDGRFHCPCRSRPLESALACRLLEEEACDPEALARVRTYLFAASTDGNNTKLDQALISGALGLPSRPLSDDEVLPTFSHHSAARKQILIDTVMYLCRARDDLPRRDDHAFEATDLHTWKRSEMMACSIIHAVATNQPERVHESELEVVAAPLRGPIIHERNHLSHLLYLFALRSYPGYRDLVDVGRSRLLATQRADGGFTLNDDQDVWLTSVAGFALAEAGADRDLLGRIGDWIVAQQQPDGGWSYSDGVFQTDIDETYTCLKLLHLLGESDRYAFALWRGHEYVHRLRNADGGWPVYRRGNPSEAAMTGGALSVLSDRPKPNAALISAGVAWLMRAQHRDGTFERSYSLSEGNAIARAVHGICDAIAEDAVPVSDKQSVRRTFERTTRFLADSQNVDGGWGHRREIPSDPISTGFAVAALGRMGYLEPVAAAIAYLRHRQQLDGSIPSRPDTVSPRPIAVDIPDLSSAYILRGVIHGTRLPTARTATRHRQYELERGNQQVAPPEEPAGGHLSAITSEDLPEGRAAHSGIVSWRPGGPEGLGTSAAHPARPNAADGHETSGRDTEPLTLPPIFCPFPFSIHPNAADADAHAIVFMERFHLYRDETQRQRLIQGKFGTLCAYENPGAAQELLNVYTDFMMWGFAFDDEYCDEGPTHDNPSELADALNRMQRAIEIPEYPLDPSDRYAVALCDIRKRLDAHAGLPRGQDFAQWMQGWFQAEIQKAARVSLGVRPNLNDYVLARMNGGGVMVYPRLVPILAGIAVAPATLADRRVHALLEMVATVVGLDTDIFSYPKERHRSDDGYNLIEVVGTDHGLPVTEAITAALAMRDRILCLYIRLRQSVTDAAPELNSYFTTLESYLRGTIEWCEETDRYRYLDGLGGPRTTQPGGVTNTPSDDTPGPLPLPSIAWWWEYDPP